MTRTPSRCIGCRAQIGQAHARGCVFARFTIEAHAILGAAVTIGKAGP